MFTARLDDAIDSSIVIAIVIDYYFSDIKGTLCYRGHQIALEQRDCNGKFSL